QWGGAEDGNAVAVNARASSTAFLQRDFHHSLSNSAKVGFDSAKLAKTPSNGGIGSGNAARKALRPLRMDGGKNRVMNILLPNSVVNFYLVPKTRSGVPT